MRQLKLEDYKAGKYIRVENYRAFILSKINYDWSWEDASLNKLASEASRQIGELNAYSLLTPNIDIYLKTLIALESNCSNKIEGAKASLKENLLEEGNLDTEKIQERQKAQRYIKAITYAKEKIKRGEWLSTKIMEEIHEILMKGEALDKDLGKVRVSQNWVGGDTLQNATYVPPPYTEVEECLTDFEQFIMNEKMDTPEVIKLAILHYQFETIHPFLGGNGRIGRIIVPLYLQNKGMLEKSALFISEYLEKNKESYFEKLEKVRNYSDMIGWIKFFLIAVIETAKLTKERLQKLDNLNQEMEYVIKNLPVKPENGKKIIDFLYENPVIDRAKIGALAGMKESTTRTIINSLLEKDIVKKTKGNHKSKILTFERYMEIFESESIRLKLC